MLLLLSVLALLSNKTTNLVQTHHNTVLCFTQRITQPCALSKKTSVLDVAHMTCEVLIARGETMHCASGLNQSQHVDMSKLCISTNELNTNIDLSSRHDKNTLISIADSNQETSVNSHVYMAACSHPTGMMLMCQS